MLQWYFISVYIVFYSLLQEIYCFNCSKRYEVYSAYSSIKLNCTKPIFSSSTDNSGTDSLSESNENLLKVKQSKLIDWVQRNYMNYHHNHNRGRRHVHYGGTNDYSGRNSLPVSVHNFKEHEKNSSTSKNNTWQYNVWGNNTQPTRRRQEGMFLNTTAPIRKKNYTTNLRNILGVHNISRNNYTLSNLQNAHNYSLPTNRTNTTYPFTSRWRRYRRNLGNAGKYTFYPAKSNRISKEVINKKINNEYTGLLKSLREVFKYRLRNPKGNHQKRIKDKEISITTTENVITSNDFPLENNRIGLPINYSEKYSIATSTESVLNNDRIIDQPNKFEKNSIATSTTSGESFLSNDRIIDHPNKFEINSVATSTTSGEPFLNNDRIIGHPNKFEKNSIATSTTSGESFLNDDRIIDQPKKFEKSYRYLNVNNHPIESNTITTGFLEDYDYPITNLNMFKKQPNIVSDSINYQHNLLLNNEQLKLEEQLLSAAFPKSKIIEKHLKKRIYDDGSFDNILSSLYGKLPGTKHRNIYRRNSNSDGMRINHVLNRDEIDANTLHSLLLMSTTQNDMNTEPEAGTYLIQVPPTRIRCPARTRWARGRCRPVF